MMSPAQTAFLGTFFNCMIIVGHHLWDFYALSS